MPALARPGLRRTTQGALGRRDRPPGLITTKPCLRGRWSQCGLVCHGPAAGETPHLPPERCVDRRRQQLFRYPSGRPAWRPLRLVPLMMLSSSRPQRSPLAPCVGRNRTAWPGVPPTCPVPRSRAVTQEPGVSGSSAVPRSAADAGRCPKRPRTLPLRQISGRLLDRPASRDRRCPDGG